jgi:hypothetical protein
MKHAKKIQQKNSSLLKFYESNKQKRLDQAKRHSFFKKGYEGKKARRLAKAGGWLPQEQWLRKKRFQNTVASYRHQLWVLRRDKWLRQNKRPFWKRKSFKRLRAEQNILSNLFFISKKQFAVSNSLERQWNSKKILYRRYYRSNTAKREFKTRIILRHYWKFRYGYYTHHKLQLFLLSVKRKTKRLFSFFCSFELVLFRYARWWGLIPVFCSDKLSKYFVTHGYIYVNFLPEVNPQYRVCSQDCIFSVTLFHTLNSRFFIPNYEHAYGKVKHLTGRKEFTKPHKGVISPFNTQFYRGTTYKKKLMRKNWTEMIVKNQEQLYLKLRALLHISTWSPLNSLHYSLLVETSYCIKVIVPVSDHSWFTLAFGALRNHNDLNIVITNRFISYSYY